MTARTGTSVLQQRTFLRDAAAGNLPSFSWIDPNFVDLGGLTGANDDHPPSDIMAGQELVFKVYNALATSPLWERTLLLIVYDEHGGFYDHVSPDRFIPPGRLQDEDWRFRRYGLRVPAIVVSPWVDPKKHSHTVFDHTSIIKTALLRFCGSQAEECIKAMGPRVMQAKHLGELLTSPKPHPPPTYGDEVVEPLVKWRTCEFRRRLLHPLADDPTIIKVEPVSILKRAFDKLRNVLIEQVPRIFDRRAELPSTPKLPPAQLEQPRHELEQSIFVAARELRSKGLPTGHP